MNQRGFTQGNEQMIPPSLALYEECRAKGESLYLDSDIYSDIIYYYIEKKEIQKAESAIADGLNIHPNSAAILLEKAYIQFDKGDIDNCEKTINTIPDQSEQEVILLKADVFLAQGKLEKTIEVLEPLKQKESLDVITNCIYLFLDYGFKQEARKWVDFGKNKFQNHTDFLIAEADFFKGTYQIKEASNTYEKLIDKDPYNENYWIGQASCLFRLQRMKLCVKACRLGLAVNDKSAELYSTLGHAYALLNKYELALENFNIAYEISDSNKEELELLIEAVSRKIKKNRSILSSQATIEQTLTDMLQNVVNTKDSQEQTKNEDEISFMDLLDCITSRIEEEAENQESSTSQDDTDPNLPTDLIDYFNDFADDQDDDKRVEKTLKLAREAYDRGDLEAAREYVDHPNRIFESTYNLERLIDTQIYLEMYHEANVYINSLENDTPSYLNTLRLTVVTLLNDVLDQEDLEQGYDRFEDIENDKLEFEVTQDNIPEFRDHLLDHGLYFLANLIDKKFKI